MTEQPRAMLHMHRPPVFDGTLATYPSTIQLRAREFWMQRLESKEFIAVLYLQSRSFNCTARLTERGRVLPMDDDYQES